MKNISLVINAILIVAVAVLFYLQLGGKNDNKSKTQNIVTSSEGLNIVYFNSDSLLSNYKMYEDERKELETMSLEYEKKLSVDQKTFEKEAREFQQRAEFLTITDREARQEKLMRKQQDLMQLQEQLTGQLARDEAAVTEKIYESIEVYLKEFVQDKNISYVFSYARGGGIWYANVANDITNELIEELNKRYAEKKKAE
jgi:outer membrane protein